MSLLAEYLTEIRTVRNLGAGVAETSYYPALANLFNAVGKQLKPRVTCLIHLQNTGAGIPEAGFFTASQIQRSTGTLIAGQKPSRGAMEVKPFSKKLDELQSSEQVLRYLTHYNQVLITNLREFRLLVLEHGQPRKVDGYTLAETTDGLFIPATVTQHAEPFPDFLERVLRRQASITDPSDLAWFLASYAREARWRAEHHPLSSFDTIKKALEESLGLRFEQEKGEHFFRSTLVQTLFYGIFSAWVLWSRSSEATAAQARFDWRTAAFYLRVPVLRKLFAEVSDPGPLNAIQITEMLDLAGDTLARVDRAAFFDKFSQADAVQYFYEPFLEAFDPQLRKDLGVWYTPREIVSYMVERVDHLLRTELNQPLGLASTEVCVLDPCCGTGAYLTAVLDRIHRTLLEAAGDDNALVPGRVRTAALSRIFGFELLPAPFVIAHMQLAAELASLGAPLSDSQRAGVFLTNALTGWVPEQEPKTSIFPDLQKEKEDAEAIKRRPTILVILGNPPYNGYSGIAKMDEERDLTTEYQDHIAGLPAPDGNGLNNLYIRFFRVAERRIAANVEGRGIISFISAYSWLDGLSHPTMRYRMLSTFEQVYIDNLHGDRKISETAPDGRASETVFAIPGQSPGILVGTAVVTLVRTSDPIKRVALYRDFQDSRAADRRQHLLNSVDNGESTYVELQPNPSLGLPLKPRAVTAAYLSWPRISDLFSNSFPCVKTSRDPLVVDIDRDRLASRMKNYLDASIPDAEIARANPVAMRLGKRFRADQVRSELAKRGFKDWQIVRYTYRPYDMRWLYWEPRTKLLDEKREELLLTTLPEEVAIVLPRQNRVTVDGPVVVSSLADVNLVDGSACAFPARVITTHTLYALSVGSNATDSFATYLQKCGMGIEDFVSHALATLHSPAFLAEHHDAMLREWPRIPLSYDSKAVEASVELGRTLSQLLNAQSAVVLSGSWSFAARLVVGNQSDIDQALTINAGWGSRGKEGVVMPREGRLTVRPWTKVELEKLTKLAAAQTPKALDLEAALALLGDTCVDVFLNGNTCWAAVPAKVWEYTLGGYQVLKKWLSYREFTLLGRPLHSEESDYFAQVVRRITAILLLSPALDASYQAILPTAVGLSNLE